ncbi:MAG TPA: zinc-binding dehydrogenase, partial [Solirubrobacterales bacterium]|nr:zinc-binding dehydrogenase [Solirubrobacterales bacterium]
TAYRMLMDQCNLQAGHNVLIWGAAGGLGVFAVQLCKAAGANAVGVVSSDAKGELIKQLGAVDYINRNEFGEMMRTDENSADPAAEKERFKASRGFAKRVKEILGDAPDIVFEHVGRATFPTSVFTVKPFGKVVIHCNQASYEDVEVHGLDPMAAPSQRIWGYETTWGSFAQFTKVQAQQLLPKPRNLSWVDSSSYGLTYFTAYRMLMDQCNLQAGHNVLIWGAAGGLGVFAVQLCKAAGANAVGVVSSDEKGELIKQLGAVDYINRREFGEMMRTDENLTDPAADKERFKASRGFAKRVKEILGDAPDTVFEHVGRATFPTSVFTVKPFGKVVICGATSGYQLDFDVRYLWMKQKQIIGSHFANAYECMRANQLMAEGKVRPVLSETMGFDGVPGAHQSMHENKHLGKIAILVGAESETEGQHEEGPGAIRAEVGA